MKWISQLVVLLLILSLSTCFLPTSAQAAIAQPDRIPLTLELLQDRLRNPFQSDGLPTVDLHGLVIDLRPENKEFRDQFSRLVKAQIQ